MPGKACQRQAGRRGQRAPRGLVRAGALTGALAGSCGVQSWEDRGAAQAGGGATGQALPPSQGSRLCLRLAPLMPLPCRGWEAVCGRVKNRAGCGACVRQAQGGGMEAGQCAYPGPATGAA